ncbi:MAG: hypothetical protein ACFCUT_01725 [Kiloniellaceae bacterium]
MREWLCIGRCDLCFLETQLQLVQRFGRGAEPLPAMVGQLVLQFGDLDVARLQFRRQTGHHIFEVAWVVRQV